MNGIKQTRLPRGAILLASDYRPPAGYRFVKRLLDLLVSVAALLLLWPLMVAIAVAIKATDGGPVFYRQRRLTRDGEEFEILKFRSMGVDAEKDGIPRLSMGDKDERVTPVGRVIRRLHLDELPQFFNILAGSMSVVGPRPERPELAGRYTKELPEFALRLRVKAGLTGYAQVYGGYDISPCDKLRMDLTYLLHPSLLEDLRLIAATVKLLFFPDRAEGRSTESLGFLLPEGRETG